jgi:hypothetical protein
LHFFVFFKNLVAALRQLPALVLPGVTVVVSPLVALMQEQLASLPPLLQVMVAPSR